MFECQQHISEKMKEKMSEKLILEEEHHTKVKDLEKEIDKLQDEISRLNVEHEMAVTNQRLVIMFMLFLSFDNRASIIF